MTRTLDLNDQNHESQLVLQGQFRPEGAWEVRVSRSVGAFEPGRVSDEQFSVTDATIEVFRGNQRLGTIPRDSLNRYTTDAFAPVPETSYTVRVSAPGIDAVSATDRVPALPSSHLSMEEEAGQEEGRRLTLRLTIEDPSAIQNYYRITLDRLTETENGTTVRGQQLFRTQNQAILDELGEFELEDENVYSGSAAVFTDVLFDGQTYTIDLEVRSRVRGPRDQPIKPTYELQMQALSKDTYRYLRTQRLVSQTEENPFASPVEIEGNVEEGYGLMGAIHVDTLRVETE